MCFLARFACSEMLRLSLHCRALKSFRLLFMFLFIVFYIFDYKTNKQKKIKYKQHKYKTQWQYALGNSGKENLLTGRNLEQNRVLFKEWWRGSKSGSLRRAHMAEDLTIHCLIWIKVILGVCFMLHFPVWYLDWVNVGNHWLLIIHLNLQCATWRQYKQAVKTTLVYHLLNLNKLKVSPILSLS